MKLDKNIRTELQELWPDRWEEIIEYYEKREETFDKLPEKIRKGMGTPKEQLIKKIKGRKALLKYEQEVIAAIIPKDKLEDGVTYIAMEGTESLCRHVDEARWDEKEGMFWYTRTKFGYTFEDTMHYFGDVVNGTLAGFTPITKHNEDL